MSGDSVRCPFCRRDPYHYVDIGVGMQPAAVNCCDLGVALFQDRDELVSKVAAHIERLEAENKELLATLDLMVNVSRSVAGFSTMAREQAVRAVAKAGAA